MVKSMEQRHKEWDITRALAALDDLADTVGRSEMIVNNRISIVIDNAVDYRWRYTISTIGKPESLITTDTFNKALEILISRLVYGG